MEYKNEPKLPPVILEPVVFEDESSNCRSRTIDFQEIEFFKREGFLIMKGLIPSNIGFDRIVDYVWDTVPPDVISRDMPDTWLDSPHEKWTPERNTVFGPMNGPNWKFRSPHGYGSEPFILDMTARHPKVIEVVANMIGKPERGPERVRGIHVVLPKHVNAKGRLGPHVDRAAAQLSAMVFIVPTPPRCGGFTIWPGSHVRMQTSFKTIYSAYVEEELKEEFAKVQRDILATTHPVEFVGEPGDVVFWHPRLIHSAGVNFSTETSNPLVRFIVPCDFQRDGFTMFDDDAGPGEKAQWWVCTRHFHEDVKPTETNMWDNWSI